MNARPFPVHVTKTLDVRTSMVHTVVNVKQDLQEMDLHARVRSLIISPLQRPFFCFTLLSSFVLSFIGSFPSIFHLS